MKDLRQRAIRGGFAKVVSQGLNLLIRTGSLMIMARLLDPKDFGLVGMVTAVIGVFNVFRDFGLSGATVQRSSVTEEQISTLFWINLLVGTILACLSMAMAPLVARFYHEPRLIGVTALLATGFVFNAAGVQHSAILERQMLFTKLSVIDILSLSTSVAAGISMAFFGFRYWALVVMTILSSLVYTICVWVSTAWIPGRPRRQIGVGSLVRFGSTLTLTGLITYASNNLEKVLLGRFWGANAVGIYGRAYQLINIPTDNLNSSAGGVAFAALSRLQNDPVRFKSYFLKGYSLVLSLTVPMALACGLFANEIIAIVLGPKWKDTAAVFRLLAPTALVFAMVNPLGWLLASLGLVRRSLAIALVLGPTMIAGYFVGLRYGPKGVALCYSTVLMLWAIPLIVWAVHRTVVSLRDILLVVSRPLVSGAVAAAIVGGLQLLYRPVISPLAQLIAEVSLLLLIYVVMLLHVMGQKLFFLDLIRGLKNESAIEEQISAAV